MGINESFISSTSAGTLNFVQEEEQRENEDYQEAETTSRGFEFLKEIFAKLILKRMRDYVEEI